MSKLIFFFILVFSFSSYGKVQYFYGETLMWTPDKKTNLGREPSLLKREFDKKENKIIETTMTIGTSKTEIYNESISTLLRIKNTSKFKVHSEKKGYYGIIEFRGKMWNWNEWGYAFKYKNGESLIGKGTLSGSDYTVEKVILNRKRSPKLLIEDKLKVISEFQYQKYLKDFVTGRIIKRMKEKPPGK